MTKIRITRLDELREHLDKMIAGEFDRLVIGGYRAGKSAALNPRCSNCGSDNVVEVTSDGERIHYCGSCKKSF